MVTPLRDKLVLSEWDMHHPCAFCGSADCDPDEMDLWVTHMVTWHGYKIVKDAPGARDGSRPRTVEMTLVGWSEHAHFSANQRVTIRPGVSVRELVGRHGTVVGYNPSTAEFAVTFAEKPTCAVLNPSDLSPYVSAQ
jgi:hypothetical protein